MIAKTLPLRIDSSVTDAADAELWVDCGNGNATADRDRIDVPGLRLRRFDLGPPPIRRALVSRIRRQIAAGAYLTPAKLDIVAERMSQDCQSAVTGCAERFLRRPHRYGRRSGSGCDSEPVH